MCRAVAFAALAAVLSSSSIARAADPTPAEILARYDAIMGPATFASEMEMTAHRDDGSTRTYGMRALKSGEKFRIWFKAPASVRGQEILRVDDNLWLYIPSVKRATRIANRDSFQGGDFNNADVLRVNYAKDYDAQLAASDDAETHRLELKARSPNTAYDAIRLWVKRGDLMPVRAQYFGTSGKLLRSAEFSDVRELDKGYRRPARVVMRNELATARWTELVIGAMDVGVEIPAQRFLQADLGR